MLIRIISIHYKADIEQVDKYLQAHRDFLQTYYDKGLFLASGPKNPRTGGIILAVGEPHVLEKIMKEDPFYLNDITDFSIVSFDPVKQSSAFMKMLEGYE